MALLGTGLSSAELDEMFRSPITIGSTTAAALFPAEVAKLLESIQWANAKGDGGACPSCGGEEPDHERGCDLYDVLCIAKGMAWAEARAALEAFGAAESDLGLLALAQAGKVTRLAAVLAHLTPGELHDCGSCPDDEPCPSGGGDTEKRARVRSALIALSALVSPG